MGLTAASYVRMLKGLLPRGEAWSSPEGSVFYKLFQAVADEMLRIDTAISGAMDEADPNTSVQVLSEWERVVGLPDPCSAIRSTLAERRDEVVTRLSTRGGQSRKFFIDLAESLGYTITIQEFDRFVAGSDAGDRLYNKDWIFAWKIIAPSNQGNVFRAGSGLAGDRLSFTTDNSFECLITRHQPAHTILMFEYI